MMTPPPPPRCCRIAPEVLLGGRQCTQAVDIFSYGGEAAGMGVGAPLGSGGVGAVASGGPDASLCGAARQPRGRHVLGGRPALRATQACTVCTR